MPHKNHVTDVFGRDISILNSYNDNLNNIDQIDPNAQDWENGYSPLHLTLFMGFLRKSFAIFKKWLSDNEFLPVDLHNNNHLLNKLDRENLNPLQLYHMILSSSTSWTYPPFITDIDPIDGILPIQKEATRQRIRSMLFEIPTENITDFLATEHGSHLLTLGSNTNFQLGTGNKDDRQKFFQLHINQLNHNILPTNNDRIVDIKISKYHSILYTTNNEIFVCGNSARGRLGNGITEKPFFSYKKLDFNSNNSGNSTSSNHNSTGNLVNINISQIEVSDHHNLLLTTDSTVYSWGWNAFGQLGYATPKVNSANESQCSATPKKINFLDLKDIKFINCSKIHSCAISSDSLVYFWGLNVGQMGNKDNSHLQFDSQYDNVSGHIIEKPIILNLQNLQIEQVVCTEFTTFIRSKGNILTVLNNYQIKTFKIPLAKPRNFKELDPFNHFTIKEIPSDVIDMKCSNKFGNNLCVRYKCGRLGLINWRNENHKLWYNVKNNILPVTLVWLPNYNFKRCLDFDVGYMGNIILCTIGGKVFKIKNTKNLTIEKLYSSKLISGRPLKVACDSTFASFTVMKSEVNDIPILFSKDNLINQFATYSPLTNNTRNSTDDNSTEILNSLNISDDDSHHFAQYDTSLENGPVFQDVISNKFDVKFIVGNTNEIICYCHKLLLNLRCSRLVKKLSNENFFTLTDNVTRLELISPIDSAEWIIRICTEKEDSSFTTNMIKEIVHFLYSDRTPSAQQSTTCLVSIVEDALHFQKLPHYLNKLFREYIDMDANKLNGIDTKILLADGHIYGHSVILSARCSFFKFLNNAAWRSHENTDENLQIVDLKNHSLKVFKCLVAQIYGFTYQKALLDSLNGLKYFESLQFLLELLQLCDELLYWNYKNFLEGMIAKYISGETVIPIFINASYCNANLLRKNCAWYIISHIGLIFTKENILLIDEYFDDTLWQELERQLGYFRNKNPGTEENQPWYKQENTDWLALFGKDVSAFNEYFMASDKKFEPVVDIKISNNNSNDSKPKLNANQRRRSSATVDKKNSSTLPVVKPQVTSRRPSSTRESFSQISRPIVDSAWKVNMANTSEMNVSDAFVEVTKKTRRKNSEISKTMTPTKNIPGRKAEILIHTETQASSELPSLLGETRKPPESLPSIEPAQTVKSIGAFKKNSQKQRKKSLLVVNSPEEKSREQPVWGTKLNNSSKQKDFPVTKTESFEKKSVRSSKALPSLLTTHSTDLKQKKGRKKNLNKDNADVKFTEFVSTGNPGGIMPYMTSTKVQVNQITATFGNAQQGLPPPVSSLEEKVAAMEFEKWFAKESSKVQKKIKKNANNLNAVYSGSQEIPDFVIGNDNNKNRRTKKKIRGNFSSKHKTQLSDALL